MRNKAARDSTSARRRTGPAMSADVARLAGVSVSAVSRTFTAGASVSEGTRRKVLGAARTLKYRPAKSAKSPYLKGSYIVGLAVAELDDLFYARVAARLSDALAPLGYRLLIFITHGQTMLDPVHRELLHFRVDALILATANASSGLAEECRHFGIPVVMLNNVDTSIDVASISGANFLGGRTIAAFLAAGGHRRLAFMSGVDDTSMELEREAGFNSFIVTAGLPKPQRVRGLYTFEGAVQATRKLLSTRERPDAIFCITDHLAMACLQTARREFGLTPGKELSIVGFDDVAMAGWPAFDLTSYSQPVDRIVGRAVDILKAALKDGQFNSVHEVVPGELVVRSSARLPARGVITRKDGTRSWSID